MKYIITKDGIYELMFPNEEQQMSFDHKTIEPAYYTTKNDWVAKKDVIKYADTVEELCDEFVLGKTKYHKPCVAKLPLDFLKECVIAKTLYDLVVYGSIWVNDELRKVAKMNDKGELELL